jgi:putative membrane protein insertion efficiency factor
MRKILIFLIVGYQRYLSPDQGLPYKLGLTHGGNCVFTPSCSEYTKQAIEKYGAIKGTTLGIKRILRCHPWQKEHFDPLV